MYIASISSFSNQWLPIGYIENFYKSGKYTLHEIWKLNDQMPATEYIDATILYHILQYIGKTALTLSQWPSSGNPMAIQCAWNLDPSVHWNATGEGIVGSQYASSGLPVALQWSSSVFQLCKLTLDRHWDTTGC